MVKNVCFIGAGRAGMSLAAVLAKHCTDIRVSITDIDSVALSSWKLHSAPFFEPNLNALVQSCSNLSFVSNVSSAVSLAEVVFVCLDSAPKVSGIGAGRAMDLSSWDQAARLIASCDGPLSQVIVECSTVPVHTSTTMQQILAANAPNRKFDVLCLPSFMAGGSAVQSWEDGLLYLLGSEKTPSAAAAADVVTGILSRWIQPERIVRSNLWSAELSKMAVNAYKAQRVAATFAVSALAERTGAVADDVMMCVGTDSRLGASCMKSGPGLGGPYLLPNMHALVYLCEHFNLHDQAAYWSAVIQMDEYQRRRLIKIVMSHIQSLKGKRAAVLGFAYKASTSDSRGSPSVDLVRALLQEGAAVYIYDPRVAAEDVMRACDYHRDVHVADVRSVTDAVRHSDCVVVCTDWDEFKSIDWASMASEMQRPAHLFDLRGTCDAVAARAAGLIVYEIGRSEGGVAK